MDSSNPSQTSRPLAHSDFADRHPGTVHLLNFFTWAHLPDYLQPVSRLMAIAAFEMCQQIPDGPELTAGLRKLLEAKDCFVRASIDDAPTH